MEKWTGLHLKSHLGPEFGADGFVLQLKLQWKGDGCVRGPRVGRLPLYEQLRGLAIHLLADQLLGSIRLYYMHTQRHKTKF